MAAITNLAHGVGKRKTSVARVYIRERKGDQGSVEVNRKSMAVYFPRKSTRKILMQPLELTSLIGRYDIYVNVKGGGLSGQAGAIKHAISRSLQKLDPELRPVLKKAGFLTRDARKVERKKYGLAGARRRYQYSKR